MNIWIIYLEFWKTTQIFRIFLILINESKVLLYFYKFELIIFYFLKYYKIKKINKILSNNDNYKYNHYINLNFDDIIGNLKEKIIKKNLLKFQ